MLRHSGQTTILGSLMANFETSNFGEYSIAGFRR
jgi:hypothetical protein